MVSFRGLIQNFRRASPPLSYAESAPGLLVSSSCLLAISSRLLVVDSGLDSGLWRVLLLTSCGLLLSTFYPVYKVRYYSIDLIVPLCPVPNTRKGIA